jgi:choloylglycine hydrolase
MSSPSRFVRAVAFANTSLGCDTAGDGVFQAFHILNAFDIPKGSIREAGGEGLTDYTIWTSAADTKSRTYYYKTYLTQAVESLDVRAAVSKVSEPKTLIMESGFSVRSRNDDL